MYALQEKQCGINLDNRTNANKSSTGYGGLLIGSGAVPAVLAIVFRFFLYDCGLYTLEVKNKPGNAFRDTQRVYGPPPSSHGVPLESPPGAGPPYSPRPSTPVQFSIADLKNFLIRDKNWYYLLGTAATWFFLDVSFYGFSLDNRGTLSDLWATSDHVPLSLSLSCWQLENGTSAVPNWNRTRSLPTWQTDNTRPCNTIYQTLLEQAQQYLLTVSIASIAGSACAIFAINRFPRRSG